MSMLYLVRHGTAEDASGGQSDAERALTQEGIRKFRRAAQGIAKLLAENPPRRLLTSPLVRARQTAEILADAFDHAKCKIDLHVSESLAPPGHLQSLLKEARRQDTVAVAHDPFLSEWIGTLCFGKPGQVTMKKGALAALELAATGAAAQLLYLLQPGILREL
jgi:phosphohistidine phosphatase